MDGFITRGHKNFRVYKSDIRLTAPEAFAHAKYCGAGKSSNRMDLLQAPKRLFGSTSLTHPIWWVRVFSLMILLVPYNESIQFKVCYDIGKNLADIMTDYSS